MIKLYRYFPLGYLDATKNNEQFSYVIEMLRNGTFLFQNPMNFNDPFDCKPKFKMNLENPEEYELLCNQMRKENPYCGYAGAVSILDKLKLDPKKTDKLIEMLENGFNENMKKSGIMCFSGKLKEILLWSHYSNGHKGYCIEFDYGEIKKYLDSNEIGALEPVVYSNDYPARTYASVDPLENIKSIIFTKSKKWAYEKEYRLLIPNMDNNPTLPLTCIKSIYFGVKISDADYSKMMDLIDNVKTSINLFKMHLAKDKYNIYPVRINNEVKNTVIG
jgi:hypothetical protein